MTTTAPVCPDCGYLIEGSVWNGGRCWDCHDASCAYSLFGDTPPAGFDPDFAGERWDDDY